MSEWETFCDRSYYDLWRVRRKNERGFNDGYHVHNGEEARALVDLLNGIERERDEAREQVKDLAAEVHRLECKADAIQEQLTFERELNRLKEVAVAFQIGEAAGEEIKETIDVLRDQLDAALMIGKLQERRHERELQQVREQYRLSSVCRKLMIENQQLKSEP